MGQHNQVTPTWLAPLATLSPRERARFLTPAAYLQPRIWAKITTEEDVRRRWALNQASVTQRTGLLFQHPAEEPSPPPTLRINPALPLRFRAADPKPCVSAAALPCRSPTWARRKRWKRYGIAWLGIPEYVTHGLNKIKRKARSKTPPGCERHAGYARPS
jgi:hypothetical protein